MAWYELASKAMEKMENKRTFPTFPRHGDGDLDETKQKFCCTWILNPSRFPAGMTERKAKATTSAEVEDVGTKKQARIGGGVGEEWVGR